MTYVGGLNLNLYETTFIVDSMLRSDDISNLRDRVTGFISNNGGEIVKLEEWGKRRLAYEINKKQYGYYVHIRFSAPPALPRLLENEYKLNESVLRYLTVRVDPRALKQEKLDQEKQQKLRETSAAEERQREEAAAAAAAAAAIADSDELPENEVEPQADPASSE